MQNDQPDNPESDADRLKRLFAQWQDRQKRAGLPWTQAHLGALVGGMTQGAISHYLQGKVKLNAASLHAFASAMGIAPSAISPTLAAESAAHDPFLGRAIPGMVFSWHEISRKLSQDEVLYLPDVFSVECPNDFMRGKIRRGDILTVSNRCLDRLHSGDGVIVIDSCAPYRQIALCIYRRSTDSHFFAETHDGTLLHSASHPMSIAYAVEGTPTLRWSRL